MEVFCFVFQYQSNQDIEKQNWVRIKCLGKTHVFSSCAKPKMQSIERQQYFAHLYYLSISDPSFRAFSKTQSLSYISIDLEINTHKNSKVVKRLKISVNLPSKCITSPQLR